MKKINKNQLLNTLFGIITAISLFFTFYFYYNDKTPMITIAKIGEINVLEINRNLDELQILYNDVDIKNSNNNIIIINFRIENKGRINITKDLFDDILDWGIEIKEGEILQARLINSNNKYIIENFKVSILQNKIIFSKVIFEKNTFFDIEIVLLKSLDTIPEYYMIGKIAGIDTEKVNVLSHLPSTDKNYFQKLIDGNILVHIGRFFFYLLILIVLGLIVILAIVPIDKVGSLLNEKKRRKIIALLSSSNTTGKYFNLLSDFYIKNGIKDMNTLYKIVTSKIELRKSMDENIHYDAIKKEHPTINSYSHYNCMTFLKQNEVFWINGDIMLVDKDFILEIKDFIINIQ
jgi:hypothetical protein